MKRSATRASIALISLAVPMALTTQALAAPGGGSSSLPKITFSSAAYSRSEAGGVAVITMKRTAPSKAITSTVAFSTSNNTASAPADFTDTDVTVTFAAKQTTQTVNVPIIQDGLFEGPETVNLVLGSPITNAQLGSQKTATLTIVDDEVASFSISDATAVTEGADAAFTVSLNGALAVPSSVTWTAVSGTATSGSDFPAQSAAVAFAPGETSKGVTVHTTDDALDEPDGETFTVELSAASAGVGIADGSGAGSINDNDAAPSVVLSDNPTATEGSSLVYTISLSAASGKAASGTVETWPGNAADARYIPVTGDAWSIPAGSTSTTFTVPTTDDATDQAGDVTVWAHLLTATNATIPAFVCNGSFPDWDCTNDGTDDAWSLGLLQDDGDSGAALPTLSIDDQSGYDITCCYSINTQTFTVTLSAPSASTVTVAFTTTDGSADSADYTPTSGTLTFLAGETSKTIDVGMLDTSLDCEGTETYTVDLSAPVNATILDGSGLGTIYDFDC
jgi:hypothetical protein